MSAVLVITNLPNREAAVRLGEKLIESGVAACVNVLASCLSIYHWQGKTESAEEVPLLIKTTAARYPEVEAVIRAYHPYELPEIIQVPITGGLPDYLDWVEKETR
jgi:periplasmic divalent cation tolerance protein